VRAFRRFLSFRPAAMAATNRLRHYARQLFSTLLFRSGDIFSFARRFVHAASFAKTSPTLMIEHFAFHSWSSSFASLFLLFLASEPTPRFSPPFSFSGAADFLSLSRRHFSAISAA